VPYVCRTGNRFIINCPIINGKHVGRKNVLEGLYFMKNEYKLLIAIIIILLIIVVGAYALSGSKGPQATATPTVQATNTPTPTPAPIASGAGGSSGGVSSPTPTTAPSATPTPTVVPSPTPSSGVEQTQFGYWITYPTLDPEQWPVYTPPPAATISPSPSPSPSPSAGSKSVQFIAVGGYARNSTYFNGLQGLDVSTINYTKPWFEANIILTRTSTSGTLSPTVVISNTDLPSGDIYINQQPTFADTQSDATMQVIFTLGGGQSYFTISPSSAYTIGTNNTFDLDTFIEW
jgi:hypothetical protein